MSRRRAPLLVLPLTALVLAVPFAAAQEEGSGGLFFDTVEVHVVNLEVMVTGHDGKPVTGLTRDDFEVSEDGKPVELTNFFAVEGGQSVATPSADGDGAYQPEPETRSLFLVIYVDNVNIRPQSRNRIFDSLRSFLETRLDPRDRVMIVSFDGRVRIAQKFTNDPALIEATLDRLEHSTGRAVTHLVEKGRLLRTMQRTQLVPRPTPTSPSRGIFESARDVALDLIVSIRNYVEVAYANVRGSTDALRLFSDSLAGMPGRKAILYVSDGMPTRPGEDLVQAWRNRFERWALTNNVSEVLARLAELPNLPQDTTREFRDLVTHASAHRVAFYPIANESQLGVGQISAEYSGEGTADGAGSYSRDVVSLDTMSREGSLLMLADGTGGIALTRSSNIAELLERMVSDFSTFYSLGYTPLNPGDGEFHQVSVKVRRPGMTVRHVKGYRELEPLQQMENLTLSALHYDFEENPLGVTLATGQHNQTAGGQYRVPLMIRFPFEKIVLLPQEGFYAGRVLAFVVVQDADGALSPFQRIALPIRVPTEQYEAALKVDAGYQVDLVMRQGEHKISVGVRDDLSNVESTVNLDVRVGLGSTAAVPAKADGP